MPAKVAVLFLVVHLSLCQTSEDNNHWRSIASTELENALKIKWNERTAKNIILFVGDGMGVNTITASRAYISEYQRKLTFDSFPHVGMLKTYSADKLISDSAATATALFSGVKTNYETIGVSPAVTRKDCAASLDPKNHLDNFFDWGQSAGKRTGFVTTTRVTHATPAAIYAHCPSRKWECEAKIPQESRSCKDIARQLVEDTPGKNIHVIMGGGRQTLVSNTTAGPNDPIDTWACYRQDGRNLIEDWKKDKVQRGVTYSVATNNRELKNISSNTDYVLGIFSNGHLNMDFARDKTPSGMPSLQQMTEGALKILYKEENGFILMVEGGMIDFAHHRGHARQALDETVAFDKAINWTLKWLDENNILDETLVIVTADHSHSLVMSGAPDRSKSILAIADSSPMDGVPYTILTYGNGGRNNYQYTSKNGKVERVNPRLNDTFDFEYSQQSGVLLDEVKHGGGDVVVFAKGPMAHLFHSVHEQNYVAYVMAYAAKIGPYSNRTSSALKFEFPFVITTITVILIVLIIILLITWVLFYPYKQKIQYLT